jgi:arylsulfatase A-like enzyme
MALTKSAWAATSLSLASAASPNILFVLTDDMGWGDVTYNTEMYQPGAGGEKWTVNPPQTPNIDALALGEGTMLFRRFYSGSALCSPTRASILTGRTPTRSCINGAEGCGTSPAWSCYGTMPFPPTEFTVAEAVKTKGYATSFVGKWHLGDFWVKDGRPSNYAVDKWPSSHPGIHGFDEWHATEASAPSTSTNCGCDPSWLTQGRGCVSSGGKWRTDKTHDCTNYWSPTDVQRSECLLSDSTSRDCVANLTSKIEGDDSEYMMDYFEDFLKRMSPTSKTAKPWFAQLSLHTNHEPHPSLPEWYNAYTEAEGGPAGDYHGTISQMDAAVGQLVDMLKTHGHHDNTMIWYTHDNGAHTSKRPSGQLSASNGLRQCKASVFEGGIRVGGFVHWPSVIKGHVDTYHAAVTNDFLPTVLDLLGVSHPHPEWAADGMSLLPLLQGDVSPTTTREKPMGFAVGKQRAWQQDFGIEGVWKLVQDPIKGQCADFSEPFGSMKSLKGPFLFNLTADPTESKDLCAKFADRCADMAKAVSDFSESIERSRVEESQCEQGSPTPAPTPIPTGGFSLQTQDGLCLTVAELVKHSVLTVDACDAGSRWSDDQGFLENLAMSKNQCLKLDRADQDDPCTEGNTLWLGGCAKTDPGFHIDEQGRLATDLCPDMCGVPATNSAVFNWASRAVALGSCDNEDTFVFSRAESVEFV